MTYLGITLVILILTKFSRDSGLQSHFYSEWNTLYQFSSVQSLSRVQLFATP